MKPSHRRVLKLLKDGYHIRRESKLDGVVLLEKQVYLDATRLPWFPGDPPMRVQVPFQTCLATVRASTLREMRALGLLGEAE